MTDVFDRIYRTRAWGTGESRSGPGSGRAATERVAAAIVALVEELGVTSVLDVGCGDGLWMPDLPGYLGLDVSEEAIEHAYRNHPDRAYLYGDAATMRVAPRGDLVIVRDALQHLPLATGTRVIDRIRAGGSPWLLASTFDGGENLDIETGDAYSPDLTAPPFDLGEPERRIFDGWDYQLGTLVRDPRKHLGLWRL